MLTFSDEYSGNSFSQLVRDCWVKGINKDSSRKCMRVIELTYNDYNIYLVKGNNGHSDPEYGMTIG